MEAKLITGGLHTICAQVVCVETQKLRQSLWKCHLTAIEMS